MGTSKHMVSLLAVKELLESLPPEASIEASAYLVVYSTDGQRGTLSVRLEGGQATLLEALLKAGVSILEERSG